MFAPDTLNNRWGISKDAMLYKGHKEEGVLGSRRTPWERSIATIKQHPLFGTGYGTSPTGEDPGFGFRKVFFERRDSSRKRQQLHDNRRVGGSFGCFAFRYAAGGYGMKVWKVCAWMKRTTDARHYSIPLAMVVLAGLIHANFEDWLFAVGYYLSVYFWVCAFLLADFVSWSVGSPSDQA